MNTAIKVDRLIKSYGSEPVIKGISFEVTKGEIFALLGTNGAGKTTTLECIESVRKYDSGNITVNGSIGVQLQSSSLPVNITSLEVIFLFSKWNKSPVNYELIHSLGLDDFKNKQYKDLSTGQKRRLHLVLSLIGNPDIIFLDEPTAGLDVEGRVSLHNEIRRLKQQGKTIIIASHDMAEVESLCDRIAILKNGEFAFIGTANELTLEIGDQSKIHIKTSFPFIPENFNDCHYEGEEQSYYIFSAKNISDALFEILSAAKNKHVDIVDIKIERTTLEQGFMNIAKEDKK